MAFNYDNYLRTSKMPTLWCWGCGDGVILKSVIRAIDAMGWNMDDVCVVSGIGCSGRFSSYVNCNTVHTTHGRAIAYATGIKLANPEKHVIVVTGDGDGLAIGGNHTIHGCRRNIDINHILINNFIYGLTNSQTSPTTPQGFWTVTAQWGNIDPNFDAAKLATAAGATFVGRETVINPTRIEKMLIEGFKHEGYSFFDIFSNCHINLGRKNKMGEATQMVKWIDDRTVSKAKFDTLSDEEKKGKFPTGILFKDENRIEYCKAYAKVKEAAQNKTKVNFEEII
ncbi:MULTISPECIES: 2-oxoglutarate ferredoxin oxidoreductase subunit beta [Campylobacter]|jgi:2-oxoglutarate ferredoxin oxidoreductase subunit beta|uniref:2-oxoglutarate ferredoxin oxidoreductase subunit beta n=2 Tax=Campylobacter TaxID=194 RepID=A0A1X9T1M3_9BACT|nr:MULTISPECIES: 2-oxoglutarate ferredoxin oxidoreductase subunit beta [Campylobacter]MCR8689941.1 2-oxoglutarate ferredoxin oxidoreductase subunit beta [Campylobacter sp. RM9264]MCR8700461.1 2-oxoglutarate ferredoxin oxidoreductase subunit beta [Campylobacter sp. RM12176]ARR02336.1 2-oxoglutarate:acceptor oxidoreductase, beta subunit [Campylobacter sp. RM8964]ARR03966.1 2-oxoglutarate:acceptor oxidoreductase, beta subunit [Campylobacter sp. RM12175]MBE6429870.1 2-oxoglutarate ferredoxin oxido